MIHGPVASIDIGTNTFRLLIADVHFDRQKSAYRIREIHSERVITRLGDGVSENGLLSDSLLKKSIDTLAIFSTTISHYNVYKTSAIATSALRKAVNSGVFLNLAKERAGLDVEVISGEREAELTACGMLMDIDHRVPSFLIDIGGGSTELMCRRPMDNQLYSSAPGDTLNPLMVRSLDLGVVYLANSYMKNDPPLKTMLDSMEQDISLRISAVYGLFKDLISPDTVLLGTAGTVTALAAMSRGLTEFRHDMIHKHVMTRDYIREMYAGISAISSAERSVMIPFDLARLDIIVPGTLILLKLMETFGFLTVTVSNYGLREGILIELYNSLSRQ